MSPVIPMMRVVTVCVFRAVGVSISENFATTQKYLSFTWETVRAPAPTASTVSAFPITESKPSAAKSGAVIAAAVMIATVD